MNPIDLLSKDELHTIKAYIESATGMPIKNEVTRVLTQWDNDKRYIFNNFFDGNCLRKSMDVSIDVACTSERLSKAISKASVSFVADVMDWMYDNVDAEWCCHSDVMNVMKLFAPSRCAAGFIDTDVTLFCKIKKPLVIKNGTKTMKAIRKALEYYEYGDMDAFARFRDTVSVITTTKKVSGTLVLSIHPIDFMSMSDNSRKWKTCTSWLTQPGCHSSGVIEMLNSSSAVVAYLMTDKNDEYIPGVPDKFWRQLLFVSDDTILGGRQYPWTSEDIAKNAISMLKQSYTGDNTYLKHGEVTMWTGPSPEDNCVNWDVLNESKNFDGVQNKLHDTVIPYTYGMYNDFLEFGEEEYYGVFTYNGDKAKRWCISGTPQCMSCGGYLDPRNPFSPGTIIGTDKKVCRHCEEWYNDKACAAV